MERWIVVTNCQTLGLTNCVQLLNPGVIVDGCDIWRFQREAAHWSDQLATYDCILLSDEITALGLVDFSRYLRIVRVPPIVFAGYHPDLCYVYHDGKAVQTPLDDYHSAIALAAFNKGLSEAQAVRLFNASMYERCGYFAAWPAERAQLLGHFDAYGYDLAPDFRQWSLREGFMYSMNHPRIGCLYDVAAAATAKAGRQPVLSTLRPHDNLLNSQIFPIYEEIAEACGVPGSYHFKAAGQYRLLTLQQFVAASFAAYRACGASAGPSAQFRTRYEAALHAI